MYRAIACRVWVMHVLAECEPQVERSSMVNTSPLQNTPLRPALMPHVCAALGMWAAVGVSLWWLDTDPDISPILLMGGSLGALVLFVPFVVRVRSHLLCAFLSLLIGTAAGLAISTVFILVLNEAADQIAHDGAQSHTFCALEDSHTGEFNSSVEALCVLESGSLERVSVIFDKNESLSCWEVFTAHGELRGEKPASGGRLTQQGLAGDVHAQTIERLGPAPFAALPYTARHACLSALSNQGGEGTLLLKALICADRSDLTGSSVYRAVRSCGLAHLVAVSGSHLAVFAGMVAAILARIRLAKGPRNMLVLALAGIYVVFAGVPISALRACAMSAVVLLSFASRRRASGLSAWAWCVGVLVILWPPNALSASFQLSAAATLGIILFGRYFAQWIGVLLFGHAQPIADVLGITIAASLATLPFSISVFGQFPLVSPLANVLATPLFALTCTIASILVPIAALIPPLSSVLGIPCFCAQALCDVAHLCAHIPCASIPVAFELPVLLCVTLTVFGVLYVLWPTPSLPAAISAACLATGALVCILIVPPALHASELVLLDLEGDSAVLVRDGPSAVLIGTGSSGPRLLKALARHDVNHLDALVVTDASAHTRVLDAVCGGIGIDHVIAFGQGYTQTKEDTIAPNNKNTQINGLLLESSLPNSCGAGNGYCSIGHLRLTSMSDVTGISNSSDEHESENGQGISGVLFQLTADTNGDGTADVTALITDEHFKPTLERAHCLKSNGPIDVLVSLQPRVDSSRDERIAKEIHPRVIMEGLVRTNEAGSDLIGSSSTGDSRHMTAHATSRVDKQKKSDVLLYKTDTCGDVVCRLLPDTMYINADRVP